MAPTASGSQPWVERYRPKTISDVSHQDEVVDALRTAVSSGSLPHLLFYGPPGTGKTSTILALARDLYGPGLFKQRVLELNASDERGISVVRDKIKMFAASAVSKVAEGPDGRTAPPFKLIILDEADSMTGDAQSALRRTMEKYTRVTRFCLICNYVSRIIEPLASRCAKFRFKPLPVGPMLFRLKHICESEHVACDEPAQLKLLEVSGGDLRRSITLLQCAAQFNGGRVDEEIVVEVSGALPSDALLPLWEAVMSNRFDNLRTQVKNVVRQGFSATMMMRQLHDMVLARSELSDDERADMLLKLAKVDKCLVDGADEELQLLDACSAFAQAKRARVVVSE
jgi:replication factor C subunit 2/4